MEKPTKKQLEQLRGLKIELDSVDPKTMFSKSSEWFYNFIMTPELKSLYEKKHSAIKAQIESIEDWIYSIEDDFIRQIFILRFIEGLSMEAIGERLYCDRKTVYNHMNKMLK